MKKTRTQSSWIRGLRGVIAMAFLVLLLAEWGAHSLAFAHSVSSEDGAAAVHSQHGTHDDLCKTMVRCPDGPRQEIPPPNAGHQIVQQNTFLFILDGARRSSELGKDPRYYRDSVTGLFRAVSPPFHPPEIS